MGGKARAGTLGGTVRAMGEDRAVAEVRAKVREFASGLGQQLDSRDLLGAMFDAGLAWIHFPAGRGGLGLDPRLQVVLERELVAAGIAIPSRQRNPLGLATVAPTLLQYGSEEQLDRFLRPLWTGEEIWCQLYSEPGAGSDLADLGTSASPDGPERWVVNGSKLWVSYAHRASWGLLLARTAPELLKHRGITCFFVDMHAPGVRINPMRELTGESVFSEVHLEHVRIPDTLRLGAVNDGWRIARASLQNERINAGDLQTRRGAEAMGEILRIWQCHRQDQRRSADSLVVGLAVNEMVFKITESMITGSRRQSPGSAPGPESSAVKLLHTEHQQNVTRAWVELLGADAGLRYDTWETLGPDADRCPGYYFLRSKLSSIGGGTSEILRNVIAEDVLGLPREARSDIKIPWKDVPR